MSGNYGNYGFIFDGLRRQFSDHHVMVHNIMLQEERGWLVTFRSKTLRDSWDNSQMWVAYFQMTGGGRLAWFHAI